MQFKDKGTTSRSFTKDGYLVVPATLSRVGIFDYHNSELGKGDKGIKRVARTEKSLFSDETIKSFENAPLTLGHPDTDVNATNWKTLAVGSMRNVRRIDDHLAGDAWIYDEKAIKLIQDKGIDELSCGYQCDLLDSSVEGADFEMSAMVGNHIAIVANGRCGNSCKLADQQKGNEKMSEKRKFLDAFLGAFGIKLTDEQAKKVEEDEEKPEGETKSKQPETKPTEKETDTEKKKVKDEDLAQKLKDAEAEIARLKDEQTKNDAEANRVAVLADAKLCFKDAQFADNANVRQIQESAIESVGVLTKDELTKLSDAEVSGAYLTAKATAKKLADKSLGLSLLKDAKPTQSFNFNDYSK
ncbi:TPA: DUF2213 domain-containing protein [Pasteurella multocida]|nr:DUF2213 domain-containing protein [Pasteurella multocida]